MVYFETVEKEDLRAWRKRQGLSQEELAEKLGVRPNTISRWELGERVIPSFLELALKQIASERQDSSEELT